MSGGRRTGATGHAVAVTHNTGPTNVARVRPEDAPAGGAHPGNRRRAKSALVAIALLPVLTLGMIIWHEIGHTVVAWALGDHTATFVIYHRSPTGSCFGCNLYHSNNLGPAANTAVHLGGVAATALAALLAALVMGWSRRPRWLRPWLLLEVVLLTWAGDLLIQIIQASMGAIPAREPVGWGLGYVDFSAAVSFASQATGWPHYAFAIAGIVAALAWSATLGALTWRSWRRSHSPVTAPPTPGPPVQHNNANTPVDDM